MRRTCSESDCAAPITHQAKTGRCRPCANRRMHADPAYQARRLAGLARFFDQPGAREERGRILGDGLRAWRASMTADQKRRASQHGRWLVAQYLSRPDIRARALSATARAKAVAGYIQTRMGWCPVALRQQYYDLVVRKRIPAAEARRIIEAEIPGTAEHAQLEIASRTLAARLRDERRRREAY